MFAGAGAILELGRITRDIPNKAQFKLAISGFVVKFAGWPKPLNPANKTPLRSRNSAPSARVVTTVGRLTAIKQHALFLEVAALVAAGDAQAVFVIVGDGELRGALEAQARARGIEARVRFLGWRRDLATIYGASDLFLLTSRNEGTPVALIESLASGVPGVSTAVGGVPDVIDSDAVGLLAPDGDAEALATRVSTLLADAERRRRMGVAGRRIALARYGLERLVADVDTLYRELLH